MNCTYPSSTTLQISNRFNIDFKLREFDNFHQLNLFDFENKQEIKEQLEGAYSKPKCWKERQFKVIIRPLLRKDYLQHNFSLVASMLQ